MKNCQDVELMLAPYVDGEAAPHDRAVVEAHIAACGCCRDRVETERAAHDVLLARRCGLRGCAPEALRSRCAAHAVGTHLAAGVLPVVFQPSQWRQWLPLSVAATLLLAVVAVFGLGLNNRVQALAFQMTIDHVKCTRFSNASASVDRHAAEQQWSVKYGWPLRVPASSSSNGLELRAVRRCAVSDGRVAHLVYDWRGEPLSIFVLPKEAAAGSAEVVERFSHDSVVWSQNGRTYVVLARGPRHPELVGVVQYVRANVY